MATKLNPNYDNMFINPYNFVRTTSKVERTEAKKGDLTGYISCFLNVKDLLALPDHFAEAGKKRFRHKMFSFRRSELRIENGELRIKN